MPIQPINKTNNYFNFNEINIDWKNIKDFLAVIKRRLLSVNFGTLVGHSTVRRAIVGENIRDLTNNEIEIQIPYGYF